MKKTFAIILCLMLVLTMFLGCANVADAPDTAVETDSSAPPETEATEEFTEEVTIKFANHMALEESTIPFWEQFKADFEERHPNITIEYVTAPYGEILNTVINMAGGGDVVDLMISEISWIPTLVNAGLVIPANQVMGDDYVSDFLPGVVAANTYQGEVYGLSMNLSPYILFYNKDLFAEAGLDPESPPTTYDEMLDMAEKLSQLKTKDGNPVYAFGQTTASVPVSGVSITAMVYNYGGTVLSSDGQLATDNEGFRQAIEMIKLLDEKGYNPQNAKLKDLRNLFAIGQLAMFYDASWGFSGIQGINPDAESFTATAAPLKGGNGNGDSVVNAHTLVFFDNGDAQTTAARILVEELITEDTLSEFMSEVNLAYPPKQSMVGMKVIEESPVLKGASSSMNSAKSIPFISATNDFNLELCTLAQAVTIGGESFDEAYATFKENALAIIAE